MSVGAVALGRSYASGAAATLAAASAAGYRFSFWSGDATGKSNPVSVTVNANKAVTANFVPLPVTYTVTTGVNLPGSGTVTGGGSYASGAAATLAAASAAGYRFSFWSGDATGKSNPVSVTVNANKAVTANFVPLPVTYTVTTGVNLPGSGTVTGGGSYASGAAATLAAASAAGYRFSFWSGDATGKANPVIVTVNANKSVTANFVLLPVTYTVTTGVNLPGSGTVTGGGSYASGAAATLTAASAAGYRFSGWSGDATGSVNPLLLTVDGPKTVTARFTASATYVVAAWA